MFLTLTPDPALDKIHLIKEWTPGIPMRAIKTTTSVGGKGLDASVALSHLGQASVGLAFLAGETGRELSRLVTAYGIKLEAIWTGGVTRTALIVSETKYSRASHLFSGGLVITSGQQEQFRQRFRDNLASAAWVICGGKVPDSMPEDFFLPYIQETHAAGVPVILDSFHGYMRSALPAQPTVVKMNRKEFECTFGVKFEGMDGLRSSMLKVHHEYGLNTLLVTCGSEGLLALTPEGIIRAVSPPQAAVNTAGAGDAASATIAWRRARGDNWHETLRWTAAVSAAAVLTEGTADCRMEDIERIYPQVEVSVR
jgi:1-phosphofructokinase family hexose kinase